MKTIASFFILLIGFTALIPKADISQLGLLGNLYSHFSEYHADSDHRSGVEGFIDFISEHYSNLQHEHQDEDEHDQLPFKEFTSSGFYVLLQESQVKPVFYVYDQEYILINTESFPGGYASSIDHPPSV